MHLTGRSHRSQPDRCRLCLRASVVAVAAAAGLMLPGAATGQTYTYTKQTSGTVTNITGWNFTNGYTSTNPIPFSSPTGIVIAQAFGGQGPAINNDLNLTVNAITFNYYGIGSN